MIYTVTLNPSLDYCLQLKRFCPGTVNRTEKEAVYPGGKGINVSIVLKNLGFPSKLLGFCAGFTGLFCGFTAAGSQRQSHHNCQSQ